ncbi:hypothetical protein BDN72DRAFT_755297 [Pluteus cervinus]|uniref:Uncharacterized protein n=1 Tax=Pluteus cervinus TaxID=181527 RepID=A0ACD3BEK4_9AGAR|nr:hypothetical protein BDN72DRAFT_755297 [Pluteus cervinus]
MVSPGDVDRLFLQAVLSRGVLSGDLARTIWQKCGDAIKAVDERMAPQNTADRAAWDAFVARINKSIDDLDLDFRQFHDEVSGKEMYGLVNKKDDEIAQMATDYSPGEIVYFRAIVEQIMLAPHEAFSVTSLAALREVSAIKPKLNFTKTQAEVVLNSFVAKGWLLKSKRGRYSLSSRAMIELNPYLKTTYPDEVLECTICMEMVTKGVACCTDNCKTRMHYHCFSTFRRRHEGCPACKIDWPEQPKQKPLKPVGEDAAKDGDEKRRVRVRSAEPSDEEDEDPEAGPSQTQTQPPRTQRKKKAQQEADEDMEPTQSTQPPPRRSQRR